MTTYARVTVKLPGGTRKTVNLAVASECRGTLIGYAVDGEGEKVLRNGAEQMFVLHRNDIVRRVPLRMNLHYAVLEPDDQERR